MADRYLPAAVSQWNRAPPQQVIRDSVERAALRRGAANYGPILARASTAGRGRQLCPASVCAGDRGRSSGSSTDGRKWG